MSYWRYNQEEVKSLNEIIDHEYFKENELTRKISIKKAFEKALDDEINGMSWDVIESFMQAHNWKWYLGGGDFNNCAIPTREQMIENLRGFNFFKRGLYHIIELGEDHFSTFSGGFNFEMAFYEGKYLVNIYFDIAHFIIES